VVLELITESRANLPIMMPALSGNASDKVAFEETIERHIGRLRADGGGPSVVVVTDAVPPSPEGA
jgi:transposase